MISATDQLDQAPIVQKARPKVLSSNPWRVHEVLAQNFDKDRTFELSPLHRLPLLANKILL
jgi:hypothetical protein